MSYKCKRCHRNILRKTYLKYNGYSRQCLAKLKELTQIESEPESNIKSIRQQMKDRLIKVLPKERPIHETQTLIWLRNWDNKIQLEIKT